MCIHRKMIRTLFTLIAVFISYSAIPGDLDSNQKTKAVVKIITESLTPDYIYPWQVGSTEQSSGTGVIIENNYILTAAHVVDNNISIYIRKPGSDKRFKADIKYISDASDLAILTIEDGGFFRGTTPIKLGKLPKLGDEIITWGFPEGGSQLAITKGIVSRIDFYEYAHSKQKNLVTQIDAAVNAGASGGPAIVEGMLAGITFQALDGEEIENIGYIVPIPVIEQFLYDIKDGKVDGVPAIAIKTQNMRNPQLRAAYKMKTEMTGTLVVQNITEPEAGENTIMTDDVLLEIDGLPVGNDGSVPFISGDRIDLNYFFTKYQLGDAIPIRLLRNGNEKLIDYTFKYNNSDIMLVTRHFSGFVPDYEILAGLVFQELSYDYLVTSFGEEDYPSWMLNVYHDYKKAWNRIEKAVFLSTILPDEINIDYDDFEDRRVVSVNGNKVDNLDDFRKAIKNNNKKFHSIQFDKPSNKILLSKKYIHERESIIKERYNVD